MGGHPKIFDAMIPNIAIPMVNQEILGDNAAPKGRANSRHHQHRSHKVSPLDIGKVNLYIQFLSSLLASGAAARLFSGPLRHKLLPFCLSEKVFSWAIWRPFQASRLRIIGEALAEVFDWRQLLAFIGSHKQPV